VEKPEDYRFADAKVVAHFSRASAVFFEYPSGRVELPDVEKQLGKVDLTEDLKVRVRQAYQESYAL